MKTSVINLICVISSCQSSLVLRGSFIVTSNAPGSGDLEMPIRSNRRLIKKFVGWLNVEVFLFTPLDCLRMNVPVHDWLIGLECSHLLLVPSLSAFADHSGLYL